ncbi:DUF4013 domain-containing protein [Natronolimnobius sp. AArcel1]|uniref:DUF4013 domain-containing protein n=1 Tax=Natronolimnobius sp. AArcel1 TaxID=1679093 RepID=UPI0013EE38E5|nr:DUF4013 domain-containing protein [Natronolimnobius sp. AArcel1]NGM69738.1 DUF4013 domain-containing protein [Natronolimnobius sp. AArcel1]
MQSATAILSYPIRGAGLERMLTGSVLVLGSPLILPALVFAGYCIRVLDSTLAGDDEPPALEVRERREWQTLTRVGVGGTAVAATYLLVPLGVGAAIAAGVAAVGYAGLVALAPLVGGNDVLIWGLSLLAALFAALLALALIASSLAIYYVLPAALAVYAHTETARAAFDRSALWPIVSSLEYAVAVGVLQIIPLVVAVVAVAALVSVVGIVALPAIPFVAALVSCRVVGAAVTASSPTMRGKLNRGSDNWPLFFESSK